MSKDERDIVTVVLVRLLSIITGGLYLYIWLLIKYLKEEC